MSTTRRYALVYGRSSEIDSDHKRELWFKKRDETGIELITADATYESSSSRSCKRPNIFRRKQDQFRIKYLHSPPVSVFAYLTKNDLNLASGQIEQLRAWGYSIDDWLAGKPLVVNDKHPFPEGPDISLNDFLK